MILNAMLLAVVRIVQGTQPNLDITIIPKLKIASDDGIQIKNPRSSYELLLTGTIDYGVVQHDNEPNAKCMYSVIVCLIIY
jgi:hypothetical protein